jgi:nitrate reductase NapE component
MARAFITASILATLVVVALAQGDVAAVRGRLEQRFQILPLADGVVLTPRFRASVRSIEVSDNGIALDGTIVTGSELRERLGVDAENVLQLSYLDRQGRRAVAGVDAPPSPKPADPTAPTVDSGTPATGPEQPESGMPRRNRREELVRIGGSASLGADEVVSGDMVVIGGDARVDGEVEGDMVVIGGSGRLGPRAHIRRDVVIVGGTLDKHPTAIIGGKLSEIGIGGMIGVPFTERWFRRGGWSGWRDGFFPVARFAGTLARVGLLVLLTAVVLLIARVPVDQIADRVAAEPVKSWAVGFLAEILFVPVLVLTIVVLAVSIIGIPLLLLVPVALVAAIIAFLVGFTGVAYHIGRLLQGRVEQLRDRPYAATFLGIAAILSPLLLARLIGLTGDLGFFVWPLVAIGVCLEYVAWTTGIGAAALVKFARPSAPPATAPHVPSTISTPPTIST